MISKSEMALRLLVDKCGDDPRYRGVTTAAMEMYKHLLIFDTLPLMRQGLYGETDLIPASKALGIALEEASLPRNVDAAIAVLDDLQRLT